MGNVEHSRPGKKAYKQDYSYEETLHYHATTRYTGGFTQDLQVIRDVYYHSTYREKFCHQRITNTVQDVETGKKIMHLYYRSWQQQWNQYHCPHNITADSPAVHFQMQPLTILALHSQPFLAPCIHSIWSHMSASIKSISFRDSFGNLSISKSFLWLL